MKRIRLPYEFDPRFYQQNFMDYYDQGGKQGLWVWHRRAGKDLTALHETCKLAHKRVGMYWHCLPSYAQARKSVWNNFVTSSGKRLMRAIFPPEIVKHPDDFRPQAEMLVELHNGSIVMLIGSDQIDSIVGAAPLHVTFSEYALCKPNSYDLIRPMLRESGGSVAFITTPRGKNHAWDIREKLKKLKHAIVDERTLHDTEAWRLWRNDDTGGFFQSAEEVLAAERAAGMQPELVRQEYECDWTAALVGSVYGDLMESLEKEGRICEFAHDGRQVFVAFDLGMNDSTAIWMWEYVDEGVDLIYHYENHGKQLAHYFEVMEKRQKEMNLTFRKIWLPHDAKASVLGAKQTIQEQFIERWGDSMVEVGPKMGLLDGIQALRWLLQQKIRIHKRCNDHLGVEALKQYHYEYDEKRKVYTNKPEHDWSSHTADCGRYLAQVVRYSKRIIKPPAKTLVVPVYARPVNMTFTLDQLFADRESHRDIRRIK